MKYRIIQTKNTKKNNHKFAFITHRPGMQDLYELYKLNNRHKRVLQALIPDNQDSPIRQLFNIIASGLTRDEDSIMLEIYGRKNFAAFSRIKTRLKEIFLRAILLQTINAESSNSRLNEAYNQFRNSIVSKFLIDLKARNLSAQLAEKSIIKSMNFHSTENVLLFARILVRYYGGGVHYNKYKMNKYIEIQKKYLKIHEWEIRAENYFLDLQRTQYQSLAAPSENIQLKAKKYMDELDSVNDINSYFFKVNKYKVKAAYYEYQKKFNELLKLSDEIIKEFNTIESKSSVFINNVNVRKLWALIQAGRNREAIAIGLKEMKFLQPGTMSWFFIAHYTLKAQLYNGSFIQSVSLITEIINSPKFNKIGESYQELFYTTLGYINLLVDSGAVLLNKDQLAKFPDFKLYKFLNTTPIFSKDKRGINVSILLMHIAFLLQRKDYNTIIDRVDSLNQYVYRYLRKDDSFRSNCMIKMVIQMSKADFNPIRTERYTRELVEQLNEVKLAGSGENIETEIIPYDVLWNIMMESIRPNAISVGKEYK